MRETLTKVEKLLRGGQTDQVVKILTELDFHDIATLVSLSKNKLKLFQILPPEVQAKVFLLLGPRLKRLFIRRLSEVELKTILELVDDEDAENILALLPDLKEKEALSTQREVQHQEDIQELLEFALETAGKLMSSTFIVVKEDFKVSDVAQKIEQFINTHDQTPVIIATDIKNQVLGRIPFALLINAEKEAKIINLIKPVPTVAHHIDQERLISILKKSPKDDLVVATDKENRPVGVVHAKDLLKVMEKEATKDLYGFAGVYGEEKALDSVSTAVHLRFRWLIVNLFTAFLAAAVVSLFQNVLAQMVILAAYMPIIAGMGGNAGTQTLAVVVRGIALGEVTPEAGRKVLAKEAMTGVINGLITGGIIALAAMLWHANPILGLILAFSMIVNLFAAGFFGAIIPLILKKLNLDPAISSAVFLTTVTDIVGFFTFLGLATLFLL